MRRQADTRKAERKATPGRGVASIRVDGVEDWDMETAGGKAG